MNKNNEIEFHTNEIYIDHKEQKQPLLMEMWKQWGLIHCAGE